MSDSQQAYDLYSSSNTEGTLQGVHNPNALHPDFVQFMNNFEPTNPNDVDMSKVSDLFYPKQEFYRTLLSTTYHVYYSSSNANSYGSGNVQLVDLRIENGRYVLTYRGLTSPTRRYVFENPRVQVNSNSITIEEGFVQLLFRLQSRTVGSSRVLNHQLVSNGRITSNYDLVTFSV